MFFNKCLRFTYNRETTTIFYKFALITCIRIECVTISKPNERGRTARGTRLIENHRDVIRELCIPI